MPTLWIVHREPRLRTVLRRIAEPLGAQFCAAPEAAAVGAAPPPWLGSLVRVVDPFPVARLFDS